MRLLYLAESYPPDYGGGAGIYIRDVCRGMAARGHEVSVLCTGEEGTPYDVVSSTDGAISVKRVCLPYLREKDPEGWSLGVGAWRRHERRIGPIIEMYVRDFKPDLVQYNAARPFGEEALAALGRAGVPVVAMFHEAWLVCLRLMLLRSPHATTCSGPGLMRCTLCIYSHYDRSKTKAFAKLPWRMLKLGPLPLYRLLRRRSLRKVVKAGTGYSRFITDVHSPYIDGPVEYIPLGISLAGLSGDSPSRPRSPLRFGFIGGAHESKGIDLILEAAETLVAEGLDFEIHVWGPGQETLESVVAEAGLGGRVILRGVYASEDMWDVYREMDVAVMATKVAEPFGRVPLEAAAVGAPTIAPAVGGITESIRHDVDGLLFRFNDSADLAVQMRRVLVEAGVLERLIANLREVSDTASRVEDLEAFYMRVLSGLG